MKKKDIRIGETYMAKVTGTVVAVRIDREHPNGGWEGTNTRTGKTIRIKSAQRLRFNCNDPRRVPVDEPEGAAAANTARKATRRPTAKPRRDTGKHAAESGDKGRPMSMLTAAVKVLEERIPVEGPMNCVQIMRHMTDKGYWAPSRGGRTPANTLYSAILREINTKGATSRFIKSNERGRFALASRV